MKKEIRPAHPSGMLDFSRYLELGDKIHWENCHLHAKKCVMLTRFELGRLLRHCVIF
jgi:hypothetical protein